MKAYRQDATREVCSRARRIKRWGFHRRTLNQGKVERVEVRGVDGRGGQQTLRFCKRGPVRRKALS